MTFFPLAFNNIFSCFKAPTQKKVLFPAAQWKLYSEKESQETEEFLRYPHGDRSRSAHLLIASFMPASVQ